MIYAFEPGKEAFEILKIVKGYALHEVWCYNIALGPGTPMCLYPHKKTGDNKFLSDKEKKAWPKEARWIVPSKTLTQMFTDFKIPTNEPYIIKIDTEGTEGGERFMLDDLESVDLVRRAEQIMLELHFGFGGTREEWAAWFDQFSDTHILKYGIWNKEVDPKKYIYITINSINELPLEWNQC
jgi:FkbM family methyltransferase